jgi:hypothetical protein
LTQDQGVNVTITIFGDFSQFSAKLFYFIKFLLLRKGKCPFLHFLKY